MLLRACDVRIFEKSISNSYNTITGLAHAVSSLTFVFICKHWFMLFGTLQTSGCIAK